MTFKSMARSVQGGARPLSEQELWQVRSPLRSAWVIAVKWSVLWQV